MASFLSLETAAELYDLSFALFEKSRELLKPAAPRQPVRGARRGPSIESFGRCSISSSSEWDERVLDHEVDRPGARAYQDRQLRAGRRADLQALCGPWENYRKHLEPVLPILAPWVAQFGYGL